MKKLAIILILIAGAFFSLLIAAPALNDNTAEKTAKELSDIPLPDETELLETVYRAGKLAGNGNGTQYFGAILIKSNLSLEELREYYAGFAKNEWECIVEKQTGADIKAIEHGRLVFQTDIGDDHYYIVYSWGERDSFLAEWDIRGH